MTGLQIKRQLVFYGRAVQQSSMGESVACCGLVRVVFFLTLFRLLAQECVYMADRCHFYTCLGAQPVLIPAHLPHPLDRLLLQFIISYMYHDIYIYISLFLFTY